MFELARSAFCKLSVGAALAGLFGSWDLLAGEPTPAIRPLAFAPPADVRPIWQPKRPTIAATTFHADDESDANEEVGADGEQVADDEPQPDETFSGARPGATFHQATTRVQMSCNWESGLKWRIRHPSEFGVAQQMSGRYSTVVARAVLPGTTRGGSQIRQVSQLESTNPFNDPFGDKIAQNAAEDEPETTSPMPSLTPPAPMPKAKSSGFQPRGSTRRDESSEPADEPAPSLEDKPRSTLRNPGANGLAAGGDQFYNDRNCSDEESKCEVQRKKVRDNPLTKFDRRALDITPSLRPRATSEQNTKEDSWKSKLDLAPPKTWHDRDGQFVAQGKFTDFVHGRVVVIGDDGEATRIPFAKLSDDDMCFVNAWWGLPSECKLGDERLAARSWTPATMTWKASALCHKPLYFEEVQLERYGHSMGPLAQPVVSGAHFFLNIAVLPYKMGINPMSECQYALGYYRPGSCAPWLLPPVPLSLRGALAETGVVLGGIYVIP